jgi:L-asparaginase
MGSKKPRVLFIFTGGTISMKVDPVTGGAVPAMSGAEILAFDPGLAELADIEVLDYGRLPGPHVTPTHMWELSRLVRKAVARDEIQAVVITHGTDTLEETAYFLELQHTSPKPVVFVGAMRNSSLLSYDGPANLRAALRTAIDEESMAMGVLVVLNQMIHAAAWATKADTQALETFRSPVFGPLGMVEADRVLFQRRLLGRTVIDARRYEPRVDLIVMHAGADGRFIEHAVSCGARGLVVEGTGNGNVPPAAVPAIQQALDAGVTVVIASRCAQGRVLDTYAYPGSGHDLRTRGVLFAGLQNGAKARILLMLALGKTTHPRRLRHLVEAGGYSLTY